MKNMGTTQKQKELCKKEIKLKNGKTISLSFLISQTGQYQIFAQNENKIVGQLQFELFRTFSRKGSQENTKHSQTGRVSNQLPKEMELSQSELQQYDIKDDTLTIEGTTYDFKKARAILTIFEVKDKNFFHVGLGSAMHEEMEKFVQKKQCTEIRLASFFPIGEFAHGSRAFYEHKGYVFENIEGIMSVHKPLPTKNHQPTTLTEHETFGTPLLLGFE